MENMINNILILDNNEKYLVLNQAIYQKKNYFFVVGLTEDENDFLNNFKFMEEVVSEGNRALQLVSDSKIIELLVKYFKPNLA